MILPYLLGQKVRQRVPAQQHGAQEVDLDRAHPLGPVDVGHGSLRSMNRRIADEDVEASEPRRGRLHEPAHLIGRRHIGGHGQHPRRIADEGR